MSPSGNESTYIFEPHSLLRDLIRNLWVIVLAGLIGAMGVFVINNNNRTIKLIKDIKFPHKHIILTPKERINKSSLKYNLKY